MQRVADRWPVQRALLGGARVADLRGRRPAARARARSSSSCSSRSTSTACRGSSASTRAASLWDAYEMGGPADVHCYTPAEFERKREQLRASCARRPSAGSSCCPSPRNADGGGRGVPAPEGPTALGRARGRRSAGPAPARRRGDRGRLRRARRSRPAPPQITSSPPSPRTTSLPPSARDHVAPRVPRITSRRAVPTIVAFGPRSGPTAGRRWPAAADGPAPRPAVAEQAVRAHVGVLAVRRRPARSSRPAATAIAPTSSRPCRAGPRAGSPKPRSRAPSPFTRHTTGSSSASVPPPTRILPSAWSASALARRRHRRRARSRRRRRSSCPAARRRRNRRTTPSSP